MKREAKKNGMTVTIKASNNELGGVEVYVHFKGVIPNKTHWRCWYMDLPNRCFC